MQIIDIEQEIDKLVFQNLGRIALVLLIFRGIAERFNPIKTPAICQGSPGDKEDRR